MDDTTYKSVLSTKLEQLRPLFEKAEKGKFDCCVDTSTDDPLLKELLEGIATILESANSKLGELEDSEKMKEEFLALAAHQLRSPLSIMRWDMELLTKYQDHLPTEILQKIEVLAKNNKKMINLVNDILTVSKINLNKVTHDIEAVDLKLVVEDTIKEFQTSITAKELNLEFFCEDNLPRVYVDQEKLQDVIMNLIENSIKFTPALGQIEIRISKKGESVVIEVSDSGIGIPKDEVSRLTQKFFRATNAVEGQSSGTGLGLFIAKEYLSAWGGKIVIESPANDSFQKKIRVKDLPGTTVYISLPIKGGENI